MSSSRVRQRPGPTPRYTREDVFAAALRLIDDRSFSMRRLGEELGLSAMSLYGYVDGREDIIEGATLLAIAAVHEEPHPDAEWDVKVAAAVRDLYRVARRHPHLAAQMVGHQASAPGLFRTRERILALLLGAGFDEGTALRSLGVLAYYALGFATGSAGFEPLPALPAEEFPRLTGLAGRYAEHASDEAFEMGLEHLIGGLRLSRP